jgi:serine/threonine protein kinase
MSVLKSPRVVSCIGGRAGCDRSYQLFLEFAPDGSLADVVCRTGGLDEPAVRAYAADIARGLAYIHGESVVHGDVKARNVVLGADGRAKLADFGCARKAGAGPIIGGTPAFMAPEVARGEEQGPAADIWSAADWDSDEGWIDVLSAAPTEVQYAVAVPAEETTDLDDAMSSEEQTAEFGVLGITMDSRDSCVLNVGVADGGSVWAHNGHQPLEISVCHELVKCKLLCGRSMNAIDFVRAQIHCSVPLFLCSLFFLFWTSSSPIATRSVSRLPETNGTLAGSGS